jgi:hypothetical protein
VARLNLTIPDPLYERLERLRDRVNVSKVCALALEKELVMLEGTAAAAAVPGDAKVQRLVQRFLRQRQAKERWHQRGRHDGEQWAVERASLEELRRVGEEWDEEQIADAESLDEVIDRDEFPTLDARELLQRWAAADRSESGQEAREAAAEVEVDWRAYLQGWHQGARELWRAAKPVLQ